MQLRYTMIGAVLILTGSITTLSAKTDPTFLTDAIQINLAEISVGDLAQNNGGSDDVKSFGKMLVEDHTASNDDFQAKRSPDGRYTALRPYERCGIPRKFIKGVSTTMGASQRSLT